MDTPSHPTNETVEPAALIHREVLQVSVLILVAIGAFLLTRAVAASNREMSVRDAAAWYRRGEQAMTAGDVDDAIEALRRATVRDRNDRRYMLALAQALALKPDADAARAVLMTLREATPEDPEINLQLARLATMRSDVTEALRYYHNALYAPWSAEQTATRRAVRLELIRFLLTHSQTARAQSELLALSSDLPDEAPVNLEVARLFARAGDNRRALDQFQRALRLDPENANALAGAGQAAFQIGDYVQARAYLRRAPIDMNEIANTREIVDLVLTNDPLANRLGSAERRHRLVSDFAYARQRLHMCVEQRLDTGTSDEAMGLQSEADAFEPELTSSTVLDQDTIETGVDLIDRIEDLLARRCGPATARDQALVLIGRQHGAVKR